ncbi:MAG TPA: acyl-phosphate glycerol 3-phosphate acyltransferase [Opitutae bacterium]|nr:acyl-phosphate glycerol 3-phosphate acyltransferase [Puniceicoccaceae bacterium]HAU58792.1 acyl-phosphate glycerol 3-phosphate acyltransferase [Opitutae bacterium]HCY57652.1 acyl-phosphate glycerol 3-phosphate acyltransferase [Opitutae bacterium]|tara:strand:+ start:9707 stop:10333 length:627 start_codon:yes stop_codon:yes gene_type:complete
MSVEAIAVTIVGYLLGSIPFGVLVAKKYGVDIYQAGSGNPGATNVLRQIGKTAGYSVFILDFLKGLVATLWFLLPIFSFSGDITLGLWGLPAAVLGHTLPLFAKFRGGKGVATAMGGLLGVMPVCLLIGLVCWVVIFFSTRYVAVASIGFGASLPVYSLVDYWTGDPDSRQIGTVFLAFLVMGWIVWRHQENLVRLKAGTENRFEKKL